MHQKSFPYGYACADTPLKKDDRQTAYDSITGTGEEPLSIGEMCLSLVVNTPLLYKTKGHYRPNGYLRCNRLAKCRVEQMGVMLEGDAGRRYFCVKRAIHADAIEHEAKGPLTALREYPSGEWLYSLSLTPDSAGTLYFEAPMLLAVLEHPRNAAPLVLAQRCEQHCSMLVRCSCPPLGGFLLSEGALGVVHATPDALLRAPHPPNVLLDRPQRWQCYGLSPRMTHDHDIEQTGGPLRTDAGYALIPGTGIYFIRSFPHL